MGPMAGGLLDYLLIFVIRTPLAVFVSLKIPSISWTSMATRRRTASCNATTFPPKWFLAMRSHKACFASSLRIGFFRLSGSAAANPMPFLVNAKVRV